MPEKYDVLFVMGKNWRKYPPKKTNKENFKLHLSIESKISVLAAGEIFKSGRCEKIIFLAGNTAGKNWPSEGAAMRCFLKKYYPFIPKEVIAIKDDSIDTVSDIENARIYLEENNLKKAAILTISYHLPRCLNLFKNYKIKAEINGMISEKEIKTRSFHYKTLIKKYSKSKRVKIECTKEVILNIIVLFDKKAKILRFITKKTRGQARD